MTIDFTEELLDYIIEFPSGEIESKFYTINKSGKEYPIARGFNFVINVWIDTGVIKDYEDMLKIIKNYMTDAHVRRYN